MRCRSNFVRCHRLVAALLTILAAHANGQTWSAAVSEMRLLDLPEVLERGVWASRWPGDSTAVLLWNGPTGRLALGLTDSACVQWSWRSAVATVPFRDVRVEDLDGDGAPELLLLDPPGRTIRVAAGWSTSDTIRVTQTIACPVPPSHVLVADVNGDRASDLIVFDENEPGLQLLLNRGKRWQVARPVAPDLPIRDAAVTFLNNDEIPDLIAFDWVRSEFHTLYGVGGGRFLDQGIYPSTASVDRLLLAPPRVDEPVRFLTVESARGLVTYWSMDDLGELAERSRSSAGAVVRASLSITPDPRGPAEFVLVLAGGRLVRYTAPGGSAPLEELESGLPERAAWAFALPGFGRRSPDIMVLAPEQLTAAFLTAPSDPGVAPDSVWFNVGVRPEAVNATDLDGDGRSELLVAHRGSRRIDVHWSSPMEGTPPGIDVPLDAASVSARRLDSVSIRFVTTHPESRMIAVQDVDRRDFSQTSTTIPVQGSPESAVEIAGEPSELAVIHSSSSSSIGVSLFEPIRPETYLEHNLSLSPPSSLLGAAIGDADGDSLSDLIMVYKPDDTSNVAVGIAYGDSVMTMRRRDLLQEFSFGDVQRAWLWSTRLNDDPLPDLVVAFPRNRQQLYVLLGHPDSLFGAPALVDSSVRVLQRGLVQLADLDGDSVVDIIAHVVRRGGVGWWKGDGRGGFEAWTTLVQARDVGGIAIADISGDRMPELILSRPAWGGVVVYQSASLIRKAQPMGDGP